MRPHRHRTGEDHSEEASTLSRAALRRTGSTRWAWVAEATSEAMTVVPMVGRSVPGGWLATPLPEASPRYTTPAPPWPPSASPSPTDPPSSAHSPPSSPARTIDDYDELFTPIREARQKASGNQLGNPAKVGEVVVHITSVEQPPPRLVLGSDALRLVTAARTAVDEDIRAWETLSRTTDFAEGAQL